MASKVSLSILIPVYNWDISQLLHTLHQQCLNLAEPGMVEVIVVDDGSSQKFSNKRLAGEFPEVQYKELSENTGRSAVRNTLIDLAQGADVLFLDADMLPDQDKFVQTYLDLARKGVDVVCGGISYQQIDKLDDAYSFYVHKSSKTEALPATVRNKTPWRYVFTSNILLRRDIVESVRFDPRFVSYGFEDIEWGIRLAKSFELFHIDNPCTHMGIMKKLQDFNKMRDSVENHYLLYSLYPKEIGRTGAVGLAMYLQHLPDTILVFFDKLFSILFHQTTWNPLLYFVFQSDKGVLLARKLKEHKTV